MLETWTGYVIGFRVGHFDIGEITDLAVEVNINIIQIDCALSGDSDDMICQWLRAEELRRHDNFL